jgi:hypothetical protein
MKPNQEIQLDIKNKKKHNGKKRDPLTFFLPSSFNLLRFWVFYRYCFPVTPHLSHLRCHFSLKIENYNDSPELRRRRLSAHVSQGHHPIIPIFQHSIIPAAELSP